MNCDCDVVVVVAAVLIVRKIQLWLQLIPVGIVAVVVGVVVVFVVDVVHLVVVAASVWRVFCCASFGPLLWERVGWHWLRRFRLGFLG